MSGAPSNMHPYRNGNNEEQNLGAPQLLLTVTVSLWKTEKWEEIFLVFMVVGV